MYDIYRKKSNPLIPKGILQKRLSESGFSEKEGGGGAIRQTEKKSFWEKMSGGSIYFFEIEIYVQTTFKLPPFGKTTWNQRLGIFFRLILISFSSCQYLNKSIEI